MTGDSNPQFFGQAVAKILRQAIMDVACSAKCRVLYDERRWSDKGHDEPDHSRESESTQSTELKPKSMRRAEVVDYGKSEDKDDR